MLPVPSTAYRSKPRGSQSYFVSGPSTLPSSVFESLRTRARLTNLAVGLILSALGFSVILNLRHWSVASGRLGLSTSLDPNGRFSSSRKPTSIGSIENTIERTEEMAGLTHLEGLGSQCKSKRLGLGVDTYPARRERTDVLQAYRSRVSRRNR
jgi:hypothetical protein